MAKFQRQVGIAQIKTRLPERASVGQAVVRTAGVASDIAAEKMTNEALEKASLAAQAFQFERDDSGALVAPKLDVAKDGVVGPTLYEREYTEQLMQRYEHQTYLDADEALQQMARDHALEPTDFDAVADKYRETVVEKALPHLQGKINDRIMSASLGFSNRIANNRAAWDHDQTIKTFELNAERDMHTFTGLVAGGATAEAVLAQTGVIEASYDMAIANRTIDEARAPAVREHMRQQVSIGRLAFRSTTVPPNDIAEVAFMKEIQGYVEGDGTVETLKNGKWVEVPVEEVFPSRRQREELVRNTTAFISDRITLRNQLDAARDRGITNQFLAEEYPKLRTAIKEGVRYEVDIVKELMLRNVTGNDPLFAAASNIYGLALSHNEDLNIRNQNAANLEASFHGLEISYASLTPQMRSMMDDVSTAMLGSDFMTAVNGELDPSPFSRQQVFNQLKGMLSTFGQESGESMPEHIREYAAAMTRMTNEHQRNQAEIVANAPVREDGSRPQSWSDLTDEEKTRGLAEMKRSTPGLDLTQTKPAARYHDGQLFTRWGEADPLTRTSWGALTEAQMGQRLADIEDLGIIPSSFTLWATGSLQNIQGLEPEEFTRLMDYSNFVFDSNRLSEKAVTAFGDRATSAMWAMATLAGPSMMQGDNKAVRDLVDKAMRGEPIVRDFYDMGDDQQTEMIESMESEFIDNYVEWFPEWWGIGDKDEIGIIRTLAPGNTIEFSPGFVERYKQLAIGYANIYGLDTEAGRKQAYVTAQRDMKREGWVLDKDAIDSRIVDSPFPLSLLSGMSDDNITDRPSAIWRNDSIRSLIDDEEVIKNSYKVAQDYAKNSASWRAYAGVGTRTPKVGVNMQLVNDGLHTREDGSQEYGFIAYVLDGSGNMRPIQDDNNLNNNKVFFFSLTQKQIQDRRERQRKELRTQSEINSEQRSKFIDAMALEDDFRRRGIIVDE